jgi:transposase
MKQEDKQLLLKDLCARLPQEEWRIIPDFPEYAVSNKGNIATLKTGKLRKFSDHKRYKQCMLRKDGKAYNRFVHRLVANAFLPLPEEGQVIDHINGIRDDNRAANLRWCTTQMNTQYAVEKGNLRKKTGVESPRHKYTHDQVLKAIDMLKIGIYTAKEISKATGIHIHMIRDLKHKRTWINDTDGLELNLKHGVKKFTDDQIRQVIKMLNGEYTIREIAKSTGVTKVIVRGVYNRTIYRRLTDNVPSLSYKAVSSRANADSIKKAITLLETLRYTCKEIRNLTGLSRSVIEKIAYHQRWTDLTQGKVLGFKGSKRIK